MRLKNTVRGREIVTDILPIGINIQETIKELQRKNWNPNKLTKKAKLTYDDCKIDRIRDKLSSCSNSDEIIRLISENILQLYDEQVGKRYACIYLVAFAKNKEPSNNINKTIKDICKKRNVTYHPLQIKKIIHNAIDDGKYLGLINGDGSINNQKFFLNWGYYHESQCLKDVFMAYKNCMIEDDEKEWYFKAYRNRHMLYYRIINGEEMNFSSPIVCRKKIKKDGKVREVYTVEKKSYEYIAIKYLKKKLDKEFSIKYANRNSITRQLFALIEDIDELSTYTIFRFDIKDFFESTDAKNIYEKYIIPSSLDISSKLLLERLININDKCNPGLATSNALIEIVGKEFDAQIQSRLNQYGVIFYSRYVDDGLIILNHNVNKDLLVNIVKELVTSCFGPGVSLHPTKQNYIIKTDNDRELDYLGYSFVRKNGKYQYGITHEKRQKYQKIIEAIVNDYLANSNIELLRQRIIYFISRTVYYNKNSFSDSNLGTWDVTGITANYCLLKNAILRDKVESSTKTYIKDMIFSTVRRITGGRLPYFINSISKAWYSIEYGIKRNKSIVFHPKIGWSTQYLCEKIRKLGYSGTLKNKSYRECVAIYYSIIKLQR